MEIELTKNTFELIKIDKIEVVNHLSPVSICI